MKSKAHSKVLNKYINKWLELPKVSEHTVAIDVLDAIIRLDMVEMLADEGISFANSSDAYKNIKVNAQKIFRWLREDVAVSDHRLFLVLPAFVAAMPEQIRMDYLNDLYEGCGVVITAPQQTSTNHLNVIDAMAAFAKEGGEANSGVLHLLNSKNTADKISALRELEEAAIAISRVIAAVKATDINMVA